MQIFKPKIDAILETLEKLGTKNIRHSRGTLYEHLVRVQGILVSWDCDLDTQFAGLCHSVYSTAYFKKTVIDTTDRKKLQILLGERAEQLVFLFSQLDRSNIEYLPEQKTFTIRNYQTQEKLDCTFTEGISLIHIMLANDIDHIGTTGVGSVYNSYKKYTPFRNILQTRALTELLKLVPADTGAKYESRKKVHVRFIAHSGVHITDGITSLVIDPWLFDSRRDKSLIQGFNPTQRTVDYLIPEPRNNVTELIPDVVCLSHFHTHHSPLNEIIEFLKLKPLTIICPMLTDDELALLKQKIGNLLFERITFIFIEKDEEITIGSLHIKAMVHLTTPITHVMFFIKLGDVSIMHIVDAHANDEDDVLMDAPFSKKWNRTNNLEPDFLFIGAAGHLKKIIRNGTRLITGGSLTPLQAAQLTSRIMPKNVGIIGIYNHSVWDERSELKLSIGEAESQFYWCVSYLTPSVTVRKLLPGDTFYF